MDGVCADSVCADGVCVCVDGGIHVDGGVCVCVCVCVCVKEEDGRSFRVDTRRTCL